MSADAPTSVPPAPAIPADERPAKPLLRNLNFQLLWVSVAASGFADRMPQLAAWAMLGIYLADSQASSIQAGTSFFFFLPYVLLGLPAGWVADTFPRKWIMMACDLGRAAVILLAFTLAPSGGASNIPEAHHWKIYAIMFCIGVFAAFFNPAKAATVPQVVPLAKLQPANAIVLGIAVIASLLGMVVGVPIVQKVSVGAGLALGAAVYATSGTLFLFMNVPRHVRAHAGPRESQVGRMLQALAYSFRHRRVLQLLLLSVLFWSAAYVVTNAVAALCKRSYGLPPSEVVSASTIMMVTVGVGMLLSSGFVAWMNTRRESAWFTMIALVLVGFALAGMAVSTSYWVATACAFFVGLAGNTAMICVATLTQSLAPDFIRGRVFAVRDLFSLSSAVVVNFVIWRRTDADEQMIPALYLFAALVALVGVQGLFRLLTRGPMPTRFVNVLWRLDRAALLIWHRLRWLGRDRVPAKGAVILASNHTTGLDPFLIQAAVPRRIRWVMLTSYQFRLLSPFWRAIEPIAIEPNKPGTSNLRAMLAALQAGEPLGFFPEGGIQREHRDLAPFHSGIGLLARRSEATIVPVWISGTPRTRNMLWHFLKPSRSTVTFGAPYKPYASMSDDQIAQDLRERLLALAARA
ncbi:MAG: MFS transporter [Planctomycetota bacterium]|nr:MFS transporter [Planctomycetota bacterium]